MWRKRRGAARGGGSVHRSGVETSCCDLKKILPPLLGLKGRKADLIKRLVGEKKKCFHRREFI